MFTNLTYQKKLRLLGIGTLLFLLICYRFSIAPTIEERNFYKKNRQLSETINNYLLPRQSTSTSIQKINSAFGQFLLDTLDNSRNLLSLVGRYCNENELQLKEYKILSLNNSDSIPVITRLVTVEGAYINCLKLIYALENKHNAGKISSVLFKSYTLANNKTTYLQCSIYTQNLIPTNND